MTWGIYCKVCNRLLWKREKPFEKGELMLSRDATHAKTGKKADGGSMLLWCGCKGGVAQQELTRGDNGPLE